MNSSYDRLTDRLSPLSPEFLSSFVGTPVVDPPRPPVQPFVLGPKRNHPVEYEIGGNEAKRRRQDQAFRKLLLAAVFPEVRRVFWISIVGSFIYVTGCIHQWSSLEWTFAPPPGYSRTDSTQIPHQPLPQYEGLQGPLAFSSTTTRPRSRIC